MNNETTTTQDYKLTMTETGAGWSYEWTSGGRYVTGGWHRGTKLEAKRAAVHNLWMSFRFAIDFEKLQTNEVRP